ncbi:MAG: DMT family transporter [Oligoflexia bacterium]|nr:DMT family transporter [Oligoflexia bacterium]MBF0367422.1 DMT family transporter [Oligoflexia bacterium]
MTAKIKSQNLSFILSLPALMVISCMFLRSTDLVVRGQLISKVDVLQMITIEHLLGSLLFLPNTMAAIRAIRSFKLSDFFFLLLVGIGASVGGIYCFTKAFYYLNPVVVILLQKLQPIFTVLFALLLLQERPTRNFLLWGGVALVASYFVSFGWNFDFSKLGGGPLTGMAFAVAAGALWGGGTVFGKRLLERASPWTLTHLRYWTGALFCLSLSSSTPTMIITPLLENPLSFSYMAIVSGFLPLLLFYQGLKQLPSILTSILELFYPFFSILLGFIVLKRPLTLIQLLACALLIFAIHKAQNKNKV